MLCVNRYIVNNLELLQMAFLPPHITIYSIVFPFEYISRQTYIHRVFI